MKVTVVPAGSAVVMPYHHHHELEQQCYVSKELNRQGSDPPGSSSAYAVVKTTTTKVTHHHNHHDNLENCEAKSATTAPVSFASSMTTATTVESSTPSTNATSTAVSANNKSKMSYEYTTASASTRKRSTSYGHPVSFPENKETQLLTTTGPNPSASSHATKSSNRCDGGKQGLSVTTTSGVKLDSSCSHQVSVQKLPWESFVDQLFGYEEVPNIRELDSESGSPGESQSYDTTEGEVFSKQASDSVAELSKQHPAETGLDHPATVERRQDNETLRLVVPVDCPREVHSNASREVEENLTVERIKVDADMEESGAVAMVVQAVADSVMPKEEPGCQSPDNSRSADTEECFTDEDEWEMRRDGPVVRKNREPTPTAAKVLASFEKRDPPARSRSYITHNHVHVDDQSSWSPAKPTPMTRALSKPTPRIRESRLPRPRKFVKRKPTPYRRRQGDAVGEAMLALNATPAQRPRKPLDSSYLVCSHAMRSEYSVTISSSLDSQTDKSIPLAVRVNKKMVIRSPETVASSSSEHPDCFIDGAPDPAHEQTKILPPSLGFESTFLSPIPPTPSPNLKGSMLKIKMVLDKTDFKQRPKPRPDREPAKQHMHKHKREELTLHDGSNEEVRKEEKTEGCEKETREHQEPFELSHQNPKTQEHSGQSCISLDRKHEASAKPRSENPLMGYADLAQQADLKNSSDEAGYMTVHTKPIDFISGTTLSTITTPPAGNTRAAKGFQVAQSKQHLLGTLSEPCAPKIGSRESPIAIPDSDDSIPLPVDGKPQGHVRQSSPTLEQFLALSKSIEALKLNAGNDPITFAKADRLAYLVDRWYMQESITLVSPNFLLTKNPNGVPTAISNMFNDPNRPYHVPETVDDVASVAVLSEKLPEIGRDTSKLLSDPEKVRAQEAYKAFVSYFNTKHRPNHPQRPVRADAPIERTTSIFSETRNMENMIRNDDVLFRLEPYLQDDDDDDAPTDDDDTPIHTVGSTIFDVEKYSVHKAGNVDRKLKDQGCNAIDLEDIQSSALCMVTDMTEIKNHLPQFVRSWLERRARKAHNVHVSSSDEEKARCLLSGQNNAHILASFSYSVAPDHADEVTHHTKAIKAIQAPAAQQNLRTIEDEENCDESSSQSSNTSTSGSSLSSSSLSP